MNRRACTDERVLRERRGQLAESERPAFEAHLGMCQTCREALSIGRDFDRRDAPAIDDGARIQRLAHAGAQWAKGGRLPRRGTAIGGRRRTALLLAASFLLLGGVATAALGGARSFAVIAFPHFHRAADATAVGGQTPRNAGAARPAGPLTTSLAEDDATAIPSPPAPPPPAPATRRTFPPPASTESAASLFASANDARRNGEARAATSLYGRLQRLFPVSPEAQRSHVSLGGLELDDGRAAAALAQFDRALQSDDATLRPEALYGRARALGALHRDTPEALAWTQLLQEFPTCPYAETARRRLATRAP